MDITKLTALRAQDRKELQTLIAAINGAQNSLRRDECGDWTIIGARGTVHATDGRFYVYLCPGSAKAWHYAKKALASFAAPSQDGDEDGMLTFTRMPNEDEAKTLRSYIGLRQTRDMPPDRALKLREHV
jgi:hypothetical protein